MVRLKIILLSLHLALFASIFLSIILKILLIREVLGFIYLTFVPGFTLISMFRFRLNMVETVLYSVGVSLSLVMLVGLVVNQFYPLIGIKRPLSLLPIFVTMLSVTLFCSFRIDGTIQVKFKSKRLMPSTLGPMLLPFLSVFGVYLFNMYSVNVLNLAVILLIATIPILITFKKVSQDYIPFVIYITSFSILYIVCLVSAYLWGWDIHHLYHWTLVVRQNLYWKPSECSLLITTIVPVVYSVITGVNLVWFYKVMFPFFVTLIPIGIYDVCRKEFGNYISTLAPFSFMFYYWFYKTFPVKQIPSELFLVLIIGLFVDNKLPSFYRMLLLTLFSFGLIVSHYGVSYFFMIVLLLVLILHNILKIRLENNTTEYFIMVYLILVIGWYMFVNNSYKFDQVANIGYNILTNLTNLITSPPNRSGISYLKYSTPTFIWVLYKYINAAFVILLSVGVLRLLLSFLENELSCRTYAFALLSIGSYIFLLSSIVITYCMGFDRTLQVVLPVLSPYIIIGFESIVKIVKLTDINKIMKFIGVFFAVYFLFNSGFMFYVTGNNLPPYCIYLDKKCWQDWRTFHLGEVCGVLWLRSHYNGKVAIPFTKIESLMSEFYGYGNYTLLTHGKYFMKRISIGTYIYLGNTIVDSGFIISGKFVSFSRTPLYRIVLNSNRVYMSRYGGCYVS